MLGKGQVSLLSIHFIFATKVHETPTAKFLGVIDRLDVTSMHQIFVQMSLVWSPEPNSVKSKSTHVTTSNTRDNHLTVSMAKTM